MRVSTSGSGLGGLRAVNFPALSLSLLEGLGRSEVSDYAGSYTVKKAWRFPGFPVPSWEVTYQTLPGWE
jgi:hypothetical protein